VNRRIRKKRHVGEFDYLGFEVVCRFDPPLIDVDSFLDSFIAFAEANGYAIGGGIDQSQMGQFVTRVRRVRRIGANRFRWAEHSCTPADGDAVYDWLRARLPTSSTIGISELRGAWH